MDPRLIAAHSSLVMKPILHCLGSHVVIPVGGPQGISLPLLFQSKLSSGKRSKKNVTNRTAQELQQDDRIKARTLLTRAQEITKNCKKALACVMSKHSPYRDYARTGNLPSGMVHDDYLQYVREKMHVILNPDETTAATVDNGENMYPVADGIGLVSCNHTDTDASTPGGTGLLTLTATDERTFNGNSAEEQPGAMSASPAVSAPAKLFTFPGYIVFALVGPIVENDSMLCYRSDLLMSAAPVYSTLVEKRTAGRAHRRKLDAEASSKQKTRRSSSNSYDVDDDESSRHTRTTTGTFEPDNSPPPMPTATLSECIQAAGIAQSRLADKGKKKAKVNDRIVAMHLKKVAGKQSMIQETKYMIDATPPR
ncbi:hypothetical protein MHU86_7687 [Fragilaria crotonensis]|nr:hypothetical protein MHU86_7687 [Fragilaria crotonensis]